jgi:hypothetical protein
MTPSFELQLSNALAGLADRLGDRMDYRALKARHLVDALAEPSAIPEEFDRRALALSALVLAGDAEAAWSIGGPVLTDAVDDDQLRSVVLIAALIAGRFAAACDMLNEAPTVAARVGDEFTTAKAALLVADERYSEAADWLTLALDRPFANAVLAPVLRLLRIQLWLTCRARSTLVVIDERTGVIEFPEQLWARCRDAIDAECEGLAAVAQGTVYALPLALTIMEWSKSQPDAELVENDRAIVSIRKCARVLIESVTAEPILDEP